MLERRRDAEKVGIRGTVWEEGTKVGSVGK